MDLICRVKASFIENLRSRGFSILANAKIRHTENGDISVILSSHLNLIDEKLLEIIRIQNYALPIDSISIKENILSMKFQRALTFSKVLGAIPVRLDYSENKSIFLHYDLENSEEDLTNYRIALLARIVGNVCRAAGYILEENESGIRLYFSSKSNNIVNDGKSNSRLVLCGPVLNIKSKQKESTIRVSNLVRLKKEALLQLMKEKNKVDNKVASSLADSVVKFDLVRVKVTSPVHVDVENSNVVTSNVIFILYNYSRLNVILHEFESRINRNLYMPLPKITEIDFNVLKEEKEWRILCDFILCFPTVIANVLRNIETGKPTPHFLCTFLYSLASSISSYYRNTKILLEKQSELVKLMYARIYLIKAVHQILHQGLEMLNIDVIPAL